MMDLQTVCCMCGDLGFLDKLFRCTGCRHRFQHLYCSNYYSEASSVKKVLCDWCRREESSTEFGWVSSWSSGMQEGGVESAFRSKYSGEQIKQVNQGKSTPCSSTKRPRTPLVRKKRLFKDGEL